MSDKVELYINKTRVMHFLSYRIDADLYTPADAFSLELANPETDIAPGLTCELKVNGALELTGVIDKVGRKISKRDGVSLTVEGRDLMGLLVDSYCEPPWRDIENMRLKTLAELLLAKVPFISRKDILYQEAVVGKGKKASATGYLADLDQGQRIGRIEAGMTIFEVLKNFSMSRGMLFYCQPSGTLVFGRPLASGAPEYRLEIKRDGKNNNVLESEVIRDISRRYSKVTVIGQQQGAESDENAAAINTGGPAASRTDAEMPFYKPYVCADNNDHVGPAMRARMILEKQRREGTQMLYIVGRHAQGNKNWTINALCRVTDEVQGVSGDYLIYGRTFEMNKQTGPITRLRLGAPGMVA